MGAKWFGASVKRKEDPDLLTGRGRFVDFLAADAVDNDRLAGVPSHHLEHLPV